MSKKEERLGKRGGRSSSSFFFFLLLSFFPLRNGKHHASKKKKKALARLQPLLFLFFPCFLLHVTNDNQHCFAHRDFMIFRFLFRTTTPTIPKKSKTFPLFSKLAPPFIDACPPPLLCSLGVCFSKRTVSFIWRIRFWFLLKFLCVKYRDGGNNHLEGGMTTTTTKSERGRGRRSTFFLRLTLSPSSLNSLRRILLANQRKMLASTAPLRAAPSSMPRAVARPAGLTVEAKWKVRPLKFEEGGAKRKIWAPRTHEKNGARRRRRRRKAKDRALSGVHPASSCIPCCGDTKAELKCSYRERAMRQ